MPNDVERRLVKIDDLKAATPNAIAMGPFGSRIKTETFVATGVPVIRGSNLAGNRLIDEGYVFVTDEKADELKAANAFPLDLVFTHRGTIGQVGIIPESARYPRYVVSQSQMKLTVDGSKVSPEFLYYFFRSQAGQYELLANTSTTGVPAIARPSTTLREIRVPLPPMEEQRAIARILGTLDDKVELSKRTNNTLEEVARALFRSWFVDFDPVRAKAAGRPTGLPAPVDALFPASFEPSRLGAVPEGWSVSTVEEEAELAYGRALKSTDRRPGPVAVMGSNGQIGEHDNALAKGPGVVVGRKGNPGFVHWVSTDFWPIDTTFYVRPRGQLTLEYLYQALAHLNLASLASDSAVPGINRSFIYGALTLVPPLEPLRAFTEVVEPLWRLSTQNEVGASTLARLRDTLLPELLSGHVRVRSG